MAEAEAPSDFLTLYLTSDFQLTSPYTLASQFPSALSTTMNVLGLGVCTILATTIHQVTEKRLSQTSETGEDVCLIFRVRMNFSANMWCRG